MRKRVIVLVSFFLAACGPQAEQPERELGLPNFMLSDFKYISINISGMKEWELRASESTMYQNSDDVYIYNFAISFYRTSNGMEILDSVLSANKGTINRKTLLVIAEGNVRILSSETSLETERIQWDNDKKHFFSEPGIPVTMEREGTVLRGYNLIADASLKEVRMEQIHATIQQ